MDWALTLLLEIVAGEMLRRLIKLAWQTIRALYSSIPVIRRNKELRYQIDELLLERDRLRVGITVLKESLNEARQRVDQLEGKSHRSLETRQQAGRKK